MKDKFSDYKGANGNYQLNCLLNDAQSGVRGMIEHIKNGDCYDKYLESLVRYDELLDFAIENTDFSPKPDKQEKPKRVKVEYVNAEFSKEWKAVRYYNEVGELFVVDCNGNYSNVNDISGTWYEVVCKNYDSLFIRIETEIDERQEFIDAASVEGFAAKSFSELVGKMYDSGKFKLLNAD